jgi:NADH:ubiquinone oxidoreductase subunit 4 (subunit M)
VPIVIFIVLIGVYPNAFLKKMEPTVNQLIQTVQSKQAQLQMENELAEKVGEIEGRR